MLGDAGDVGRRRHRSQGQDEMVESQRHRRPGDRVLQIDALGVEVDVHDLTQHVLRALELGAHRRNDVPRFDPARTDFGQHRREQRKIIAAHQRDRCFALAQA
jgi:hypothetical protein